MNQYSIKGFPDLLTTSTQFNKLKTREKKLLLLDRCNWFISSIIKEHLKLDFPYGTYVNLHSQILKKYLGDRTYKDVQMCLIGLGIIIENPKYSTNKFSKSFSLTPKAIKLETEETHIYSKKFNSKIKALSEINFRETYSHPILKKILDNTAKLLVVEEPLYYVEQIIPQPKYVETNERLIDISEEVNSFRVDRYDAYYNSFYALNEITDPEVLFNYSLNYRPSVVKSGRIYHTIASMPKLIRECLRTKSNELIWEVDMTSAQPSIIFLEWLNYAKKNYKNSIKSEYDLCLKLLLSGGIYAYIQDNSEYFKDLSYKKLKQSILAAINAKNKPTKQNKELSRLFPNVMLWVNAIKKKSGYKKVSFIGQNAEANIFVEVYKNLPDKEFALIIHDCILTTKKNIETVKTLLENRVRELYQDIITPQNKLDNLFKTELVSIPDEMLEKNQRDAYFKQQYENGINS
jgi:hypothetical protein